MQAQKNNDWLTTQQTDLEITHLIGQVMDRWCNNEEIIIQNMAQYQPRTQQLAQHQNAIGWNTWMDAFTAETWAQTQHAYFLWITSKRTGNRWVRALIQKLWEMACDMWKYRRKMLNHPQSAHIPHQRTALQHRVTLLYQQWNQAIYPCLQRWFSTPIDQLLHEPIPFLEEWCQAVEALPNNLIPC